MMKALLFGFFGVALVLASANTKQCLLGKNWQGTAQISWEYAGPNCYGSLQDEQSYDDYGVFFNFDQDGTLDGFHQSGAIELSLIDRTAWYGTWKVLDDDDDSSQSSSDDDDGVVRFSGYVHTDCIFGLCLDGNPDTNFFGDNAFWQYYQCDMKLDCEKSSSSSSTSSDDDDDNCSSDHAKVACIGAFVRGDIGQPVCFEGEESVFAHVTLTADLRAEELVSDHNGYFADDDDSIHDMVGTWLGGVSQTYYEGFPGCESTAKRALPELPKLKPLELVTEKRDTELLQQMLDQFQEVFASGA